MYEPPICLNCKHFIEKEGFFCTAYPNGIPRGIIANEVDHRFALQNDNGIRFEAIDLALPMPDGIGGGDIWADSDLKPVI